MGMDLMDKGDVYDVHYVHAHCYNVTMTQVAIDIFTNLRYD